MCADAAHQLPVRRAATGQHHEPGPRRQMQLIVQRQRTRRQFRKSRESVWRRQLRCLEPNPVEKRFAEQLAPGAFGWRRVKERVFEPMLNDLLLRLSARGPVAVPIKRLPASRKLTHGQIDQDVRRSGVEREESWFPDAAPVNRSHVADAAQVVHANMRAGSAESNLMKQSRQRRALTARRDVRRPNIADDRSAQPPGQISRFAKLQCGGVLSTRMMPHGLSMQSRELYPLSPQTALRPVRVETAQIVVPLAQFVAGRLIGRRRVQTLSQLLWEFRLPV